MKLYGRTDGQRQTYIPPPSTWDNNKIRIRTEACSLYIVIHQSEIRCKLMADNIKPSTT